MVSLFTGRKRLSYESILRRCCDVGLKMAEILACTSKPGAIRPEKIAICTLAVSLGRSLDEREVAALCQMNASAMVEMHVSKTTSVSKEKLCSGDFLRSIGRQRLSKLRFAIPKDASVLKNMHG